MIAVRREAFNTHCLARAPVAEIRDSLCCQKWFWAASGCISGKNSAAYPYLPLCTENVVLDPRFAATVCIIDIVC